MTSKSWPEMSCRRYAGAGPRKAGHLEKAVRGGPGLGASDCFSFAANFTDGVRPRPWDSTLVFPSVDNC